MMRGEDPRVMIVGIPARTAPDIAGTGAGGGCRRGKVGGRMMRGEDPRVMIMRIPLGQRPTSPARVPAREGWRADISLGTINLFHLTAP